jgi:hypothetical protein
MNALVTAVLNHNDVVKAAREALAECEPLRLMMEGVTEIANRRLREQDGEVVAELSVIDVATSLVIEAMFEASDDVGMATFVSAYAETNVLGNEKLAAFFNLLTGELMAAVSDADGGGFMEWLLEGAPRD